MASAAPTENASLTVIEVRPRGRPSTYTDELAEIICERIAAGETLTAICLDEDMPAIRTVSGWLMRRADFSAKYALARETQMHLEAEQIREIADNAYEDYYIDYKTDKDGALVPYVVVNRESIERARLRIGARQWRAERLNRRVYASSVKHEHEVSTHAPNGAEQLPAGLEWLAGQLPAQEARPEPDAGGVGEE